MLVGNRQSQNFFSVTQTLEHLDVFSYPKHYNSTKIHNFMSSECLRVTSFHPQKNAFFGTLFETIFAIKKFKVWVSKKLSKLNVSVTWVTNIFGECLYDVSVSD